jgi:methylated-DNA-[protein]-cysteine S-methyltransferase
MIDLESLLRERAGFDGGNGGRDMVPEFTVPEGIELVSYCVEDSPVGELLLARTRRGLVRVAFLRAGSGDCAAGVSDPGSVLQQLSDQITPRVLEQPAALDEVRRELEQFFAGKRHDFELPLDWQLTGGFTRKVLRATAAIPFGELSSYKRVATKAGSPKAFRAAGTALGANPIPIVVPCHRVLHSGGGLGGYAGGLERKLTLLELEGHRR